MVRPRRTRGDRDSCELCERSVERFTVHHLIPRARGGNHGPTALLCPTCHRQVHAMFSVTTLAEEMYSVDLLRSNPRVADFLRWMRKQRGASFRVRRSRERG
ncbi:MAG: HNH endonuclease signature motif containing protein [Chloroflexota bacterium]|nr:HNH endonuclease signature motif containing protein [Chloroflexota bacterium]MDE2961888.1 HNH endonuclease signature motif containing protein [Chloroflexota bacterium]